MTQPGATASETQRQALRHAAQWHVRLRESATTADERAWRAWLDSDPLNRWAWGRVEQLRERFAGVPGDLALDTLERAASKVGRRAVLKGLALAAGAGSITWAAGRQGAGQRWLADLSTAAGDIRPVTLDDGSTLVLNSASAVDVRFSAAQRLVVLRQGEIMVTAAGDALRPFVVATGQGRVRALGTRFSVREFAGRTEVNVYEHSVEITTAGGEQRIVAAGGAASFDRRHIEPSPDATASDAWTRRLLVVDDMPLDAFLADLGRYRAGMVRCDPALARYRISGAFRTDDTDQALRALEKAFPVRVRQFTRFWVQVSPLG